MATITHTPVRLDARRSAQAAESKPTTFVSPETLDRSAEWSSEPSRAASVAPVLVAFGALISFAVGIAYFGREAVVLTSSLLGGF